MTTKISYSLPLRGYPSQRLSDRRAGIIASASCLDTIDKIQEFRQELTRCGEFDQVIDWWNGYAKAQILEALTLCHIASYPEGEAYLESTGEQKKIGEHTRYLLKRLEPKYRESMLAQPRVSESGQIFLTFPSIQVRVPLKAGCFVEGGITWFETINLLRQSDAGRSIFEWLAELQPKPDNSYAMFDTAFCIVSLLTHVGLPGDEIKTRLAGIFLRNDIFNLSARAYVQAAKLYEKAGRPDRAGEALELAAAAYKKGGESALSSCTMELAAKAYQRTADICILNEYYVLAAINSKAAARTFLQAGQFMFGADAWEQAADAYERAMNAHKQALKDHEFESLARMFKESGVNYASPSGESIVAAIETSESGALLRYGVVGLPDKVSEARGRAAEIRAGRLPGKTIGQREQADIPVTASKVRTKAAWERDFYACFELAETPGERDLMRKMLQCHFHPDKHRGEAVQYEEIFKAIDYAFRATGPEALINAFRFMSQAASG
ncbi:hypothetical protein [Burkholderia sp. Bp8986]|uniref:hypothetical protein n=1 Tax=Burkholderia sp. Bp8986 TaxID=2184550 RepID=UPI000F5AD187|nr:hypothetical protein [Burkholderia sp. Bp8986]